MRCCSCEEESQIGQLRGWQNLLPCWWVWWWILPVLLVRGRDMLPSSCFFIYFGIPVAFHDTRWFLSTNIMFDVRSETPNVTAEQKIFLNKWMISLNQGHTLLKAINIGINGTLLLDVLQLFYSLMNISLCESIGQHITELLPSNRLPGQTNVFQPSGGPALEVTNSNVNPLIIRCWLTYQSTFHKQLTS